MIPTLIGLKTKNWVALMVVVVVVLIFTSHTYASDNVELNSEMETMLNDSLTANSVKSLAMVSWMIFDMCKGQLRSQYNGMAEESTAECIEKHQEQSSKLYATARAGMSRYEDARTRLDEYYRWRQAAMEKLRASAGHRSWKEVGPELDDLGSDLRERGEKLGKEIDTLMGQ